jgi:putative ABC transport system substrate-binding protein
MRRRRFMAGALLALARPASRAAAQPGRIRRIGVLGPRELPNLDAFREGMRELGWVEGQNVAYEHRWGQRPDQQRGAAASLVSEKVDVILAPGTLAALTAKRGTDTIPIVFAVVSDPVGTGLVASLARPGGNVTGVTTLNAELSGKRLELVKEMLPRLARVGYVFAEADPSNVAGLDHVRAAARTLGLELRTFGVRERHHLDLAFHEMAKQGVDAVVASASTLLTPHRAYLIELATRSRLPSMYAAVGYVEAGGLIAYAASFADNHRRAASFVDKILKGARPADLPVQQPTKFELVVNLKTAQALGLTLPPTLLLRADRVIE